MDLLGHRRLARRRLIERPSVSATYDFSRAGTGDYSIDPSNLFTHIDSDGTPKALHATVEGIAKVKLSGDLTVSRHAHDKRILSNGCSAEEEKKLHDAAVAAGYLINKSLYYLNKSSGKARYKAWFGRPDRTRKDHVKSVFTNMREKANILKVTYECGVCTAKHLSTKGGMCILP